MLLIPAAILALPGLATAAQSSTEIDLSELRPSPGSAKSRQLSGAPLSRRKHIIRPGSSKNATSASTGSITITSAQPCKMARDMSEKMGLLVSAPHRLQGAETVRATCAGLNVTVACGLSGAELYTYERLLSSKGEQLLVFEGGESGERIVERLANHLGLLFKKSDPEAEKLPLTYIFSPFGSWPKEVQLTILAAPDNQAR